MFKRSYFVVSRPLSGYRNTGLNSENKDKNVRNPSSILLKRLQHAGRDGNTKQIK
jgi:hypothetical protein